jgi:hypothetical protein
MLAVALALPLVAAQAQAAEGASLPAQACRCTMSFAMLTLQVVDATGAPVSGARLTVADSATGRTLRRLDPQSVPDGTYEFITDGDKRYVGAGRTLRITVRAGARRGTTFQRVGTDQPCGCHVRRLAGDERVVIR